MQANKQTNKQLYIVSVAYFEKIVKELLSVLSLLECLCGWELFARNLIVDWQHVNTWVVLSAAIAACIVCRATTLPWECAATEDGRWFTRPIPSPILESYDPAIKLFTGDCVIYPRPRFIAELVKMQLFAVQRQTRQTAGRDRIVATDVGARYARIYGPDASRQHL